MPTKSIYSLFTLLAVTVLMVLPPLASAEISHASEHGFVSEHELVLAAPPAEAYRALVQDVARWWDASHSFGLRASAFSIDDRAGGCFCEVVGDVAVEHMRVVNVERGKSLVLRGGLGPLQSMAVTGSMSFQFVPHAEGTLLRYKYSVGGYLPGGLAELAQPVDQVQLGQLKRLQAFVAGEEPNK